MEYLWNIIWKLFRVSIIRRKSENYAIRAFQEIIVVNPILRNTIQITRAVPDTQLPPMRNCTSIELVGHLGINF